MLSAVFYRRLVFSTLFLFIEKVATFANLAVVYIFISQTVFNDNIDRHTKLFSLKIIIGIYEMRIAGDAFSINLSRTV